MISWIQRYFQHHFRTIFAVLLALVIISFIFTIGASPGLGRADRTSVQRPFFAYNLGSEADQQKLRGDAEISAGLQMGSFGGIDQEQLLNYALQRAASLHLADQLHLPAATPDEIAESIKTLRAFSGANGQFDPQAYETFRKNLKVGGRINETEIARVLGDDVRADKVQKLLSGPGYALPDEVKTQLIRSDTTWTLATATADFAAFKPEIKNSDADLTKYFQDNALRYEIPAQVTAAAVNFPAAAYVATSTPTEAEIRAFYDANPVRFAKPIEAKPTDPKAPTPTPAKPDPAADYAAARPKVESELKLERGRQLAIKAASDFVFSLYTSKVAPGPALDNALSSQKLSLVPLAPFTRDNGPAEFAGSPETTAAAAKLDAQQYYTEALPTPTGATVLFWKSTTPSRAPSFVEVREKVSADYLDAQKRQRFASLIQTLPELLQARIKAGDSWDKAVAAVAATSGLKIEAKTLPAFTPRTPPADLDYSVSAGLDRLEKGQVLVTSPEKGLLVYAVEKKAPDLNPANPQLVTTRGQLASFGARVGSGSIRGEVVERELKRTAPKEP